MLTETWNLSVGLEASRTFQTLPQPWNLFWSPPGSVGLLPLGTLNITESYTRSLHLTRHKKTPEASNDHNGVQRSVRCEGQFQNVTLGAVMCWHVYCYSIVSGTQKCFSSKNSFDEYAYGRSIYNAYVALGVSCMHYNTY